MYAHLFNVHADYDGYACGGSTRVHGAQGGSQGLLQSCGDMASAPSTFNMSLHGPTTTYKAGANVTVGLKGFFHQGVMRLAMCYFADSSCSS